MAVNMSGISQQQNIQSSVSAQQNSSRTQNAQPSQYGFDQVTLSASVVPAASASGTRTSNGTTPYAEQSENKSRSVKTANNQTVKAVSDEEKHKDNREAYDLLKPAAQLKTLLALAGKIFSGEA